MVLTERKFMRYLLLLAGGLLTGLTLIFPDVGFLEWLTLVPVGIFLLEVASDSSVRLRRLYGYGLFFFYCFYLTTFHWFVNLYPLDFIDGMTRGGALAVVLVSWLGLSLLQALMGGVSFVVIGVLFRGRFAVRYPVLRPILAAGVWAVYEWTQTLGWWGVPWGRLPLGQRSDLVGLQTASWFGSYFVTFLLVAVNLLLAFVLLSVRKESREAWKRGAVRVACLLTVGLLAFQYGAGTILWATSPRGGETVTVAAIQGNVSSNEKWSIHSTERTKEIYRKYTLKAAEEGAQIVLWPETALPYLVRGGNGLYYFLSDLAQEANVTILVGAFSEGEGGEYNSLLCFTPDGRMRDEVYSKRRLVPFGEFVPMRGLIETLIPPLAELVMSGEDVPAGEGANLFYLEEGTVGSLICFDSIYEELTRESVREGAELICLSTNDSWFTDSAALYMHNGQAQLRAIESGRYIVRSANTGISTVISDRGEVLAELAPLVDGMLVEEIPLRSHTTLYMRIGNLFVYLWLCVILAFLGVEAFLYGRRRSFMKKEARSLDNSSEI